MGKLNIGAGYLGLPGFYESSRVLPVYVVGQQKPSPGLMLGGFVLSSHDGTFGRQTSIAPVPLSSNLDVMRKADSHTCTYHTRTDG